MLFTHIMDTQQHIKHTKTHVGAALWHKFIRGDPSTSQWVLCFLKIEISLPSRKRELCTFFNPPYFEKQIKTRQILPRTLIFNWICIIHHDVICHNVMTSFVITSYVMTLYVITEDVMTLYVMMSYAMMSYVMMTYGWFHLATAKIYCHWWKLQYCNRC